MNSQDGWIMTKRSEARNLTLKTLNLKHSDTAAFDTTRQ